MATYTCEWDQAGDGTFSTDISGYVMDVHIDRGRKTDLETMPPGYATLILNNADGRFSPDKAAGTYYPDVEMYRRVRIAVNHSATDYGLFWGWILGWDNKPKTTEQTVTWFLGDRFAILQDRKTSVPLSQRIAVQTALHKIFDEVEGRNLISNPSIEENLTGYSGLQGITPTRDSTMKFDGDWTIRCDCPGDNAGEGWQYDATADLLADTWYIISVYARVNEGSTSLKFQARDEGGASPGVRATISKVIGTVWERLSPTGSFKFAADSTSRYLEFFTNNAVEIVVWSDAVFAWEIQGELDRISRSFNDGTAEIELLAAYRESALDTLQAVIESEPRAFFFMWHYVAAPFNLEYATFRDKDYRTTAIAAGPVATFSDDGADTPYHDLVLGEDAIDRISEVEVVSQGTYLDENEEVTVWELSPTGQLVAATETVNYRARYSQPARDCSLVIDPMAETFEIPAEASDGWGGYNWPVDEWVWAASTTSAALAVGFHAGFGNPYKRRTYLRFDTASIPDGATVSTAKLRLWVYADQTNIDFTLNVREKAWLAGGLTEADWSAVPGNDALVGSISTEDLPPAGQWFEITLDDLTKINKTGDTEFCLSSDREEAGSANGIEMLRLYAYGDADKRPRLIVNYSGLDQGSSTLDNYGVGADISITAGASPLYVTAVEVKGKPLKGTSEESKVIAAAPSPPPVDRTLSVALPLQGSRTSSMETEATRLAARYDGRTRRPALVLRPKTDAVRTQMLVREIGELIHVENIGSAYGTWIDGNYWIEGISHDFQPGGEHETVFYLEEE